MKKRYVTGLSEITNEDPNKIGDFVEDALKVVFKYFMDAASGVVIGLDVTSSSSGAISVASGIVLDSTFAFGELESPSGITITIPNSGTHYHTVTAKYSEIYDTPQSGWTILDTDTGEESYVSLNRRKFGSVVIKVNEDTLPASVPTDEIPLALLTVTTSGVTNVDTKVKRLARASTLDNSIGVEKLLEFSPILESIDGLDITFRGGKFRSDNVFYNISDTELTLTNNSTNYIQITNAGNIISNTSSFVSGNVMLAEVVTSGGLITTVTEKKTIFGAADYVNAINDVKKTLWMNI